MGYFRATKHPWPTLVLLVPLLLVYETGVFWFGGPRPDLIRNGADAWLRMALQAYGLGQMIVTPVLVALIFAAWSWWCRHDRPSGVLGICAGMGLECFSFAVLLWGLSHGFSPLLQRLGIVLTLTPEFDPVMARVITFIGAGIYEEILFRFLLFSGLALLLRLALVPRFQALFLAALISSFLFAAAHHVGPYGEPMNSYVFLFRFMAGLYFSAVYQFRGFAVAAGAHACYDVLVGLAV